MKPDEPSDVVVSDPPSVEFVPDSSDAGGAGSDAALFLFSTACLAISPDATAGFQTHLSVLQSPSVVAALQAAMASSSVVSGFGLHVPSLGCSGVPPS